MAERPDLDTSEEVEPVAMLTEDPEIDEIKFESNTGMIDFSKQLQNEFNIKRVDSIVQDINFNGKDSCMERPNEVVISNRNLSHSNYTNSDKSYEKKQTSKSGSKFERFRLKASVIDHKKSDHKSTASGYQSEQQNTSINQRNITKINQIVNNEKHEIFTFPSKKTVGFRGQLSWRSSDSFSLDSSSSDSSSSDSDEEKVSCT